MKKKTVVAIILAAGKGRRFSNTKLKQFHRIQNTPLLRTVLNHLASFSFIKKILVVTPLHKKGVAEKITTAFARKHPHLTISFVPGGTSRRASTENALSYLSTEPPSHVVLFDANRITSPIFTKKVYEKGLETGAAVLGREITDSLGTLSVNQSMVTPLPRNTALRLLYTPHCYSYAILRNAHLAAPKDGDYENAELVALSGVSVSFVRCPLLDVKVTFPEDVRILTTDRRRSVRSKK